MRFIAALLILIMSAPAMAADNNNAVCQTLVKHKPMNNVIYKGGVDMNGNAVAPADVNEPQLPIDEVIKVPLTIDLAKRVAALQGSGVQMENNMGMLEIHSDGKVMYGDKDWTEPVMTLCGQSYAVIEEIEVQKAASAPAPEPQPEAVVEAPAAPQAPARPEGTMVRTVKTISTQPTGVPNPMMQPRDTISKPVEVETASVRPAMEPSMQRVSKPDLRMVEQPKPIEVAPTEAIPPKDESRVIFNDPNAAERIDGGEFRE